MIALVGCPLVPGFSLNTNAGPNVAFGIIVSTESIDFGSATNSVDVTVRKSFSSRPMSPVTATSASPWIVPILPADTLDRISDGPNDPVSITITVDRSKMAVGLNTGTVIIGSSGAVSKTIQVTAFQGIVASFLASPLVGFVGQTIQFTDTSTVNAGGSPITSWLWDFGDGTTSTLRNPTHAYSAPGQYTITFTASSATSTGTVTNPNFINILTPTAPIASFTFSPQSAVPNQPFTFINTSTLGSSGTATYLWDFGDGATSTDVDPVHSYAATGTYFVTLTVTTAFGTNTSPPAAIVVTDSVAPQANFSFNKDFIIENEAITFTDTSTQGTLDILSYSWNFGDGGTSTARNPVHIYTEAGIYTVTLTINTLVESDIETKTNIITVDDRTALDDYLNNGDSTFGWTEIGKTFKGLSAVTQIYLTSQRWRTASDIYRIGNTTFAPGQATNWTHNMTVYQPSSFKQSKGGVSDPPENTALLFINGGSNGDSPSTNSILSTMAFETGMVVVNLGQVPNQPIFFADMPNNGLTEDTAIAYTYDKYLNSLAANQEDDDWPLLLPMVKSAVRAMDATQQFMTTQGLQINDFIVTGISKRGWTTWLTAAGLRDGRVKGIMPAVIDFLNARPSLLRHLRSYNGFSPFVEDYVDFGIFDRMNTDEATALLNIVDPIEYNIRLRMPKLVIHATRDEFFMPDSTEFYFEQLTGPKWVLPIQNAGHSLQVQGETSPLSLDMLASQKAFMVSISDDGDDDGGPDLPTPSVSFSYNDPKNSVTVVPSGGTVEEAILWVAYDDTPNFRDFRQTVNADGVVPNWDPQPPLTADTSGNYVATVSIPDTGWRAYFVQVKFESGHIFGSEVRIVPQTLPFSTRDFNDGGNDISP